MGGQRRTSKERGQVSAQESARIPRRSVETKSSQYVHSFKPFNSSSNSTKSFENPIDNVKCLYTNADQLLNKRNELLAAIDLYKPDIIGICEVKPKSTRYVIEESELSIDNYDIFHNLEKHGRGLVLYVNKHLKASLCENIKNEFSEKVFVECKLTNNSKLLIRSRESDKYLF